MPRSNSDLHDDLRATLAARQELGSEHDDIMVSTFLDRLERHIDERVSSRSRSGNNAGLAIMGLLLAVPIEAIAAANAGTVGLIVGLAAVVAMVVAGVQPKK